MSDERWESMWMNCGRADLDFWGVKTKQTFSRGVGVDESKKVYIDFLILYDTSLFVQLQMAPCGLVGVDGNGGGGVVSWGHG